MSLARMCDDKVGGGHAGCCVRVQGVCVCEQVERVREHLQDGLLRVRKVHEALIQEGYE